MRTRECARGLVLCAVVVAGGGGRHGAAHAGVADRLYDDVKSVIEDLITDEVARQLLPRLVCHGRHTALEGKGHRERYAVEIQKDGALTAYSLDVLLHFPDTAYRIATRQYGMLRSSIRREAID